MDKMKNTTDSFSMFCISSPMPVKMLSSLKKKKLPEVRLGQSYQAELPAPLSVEVSQVYFCPSKPIRDYLGNKERFGPQLRQTGPSHLAWEDGSGWDKR